MDLQEFVAQTLIQISEGVAAARAKKGHNIAPHLDVHRGEDTGDVLLTDSGGTAHLVAFDVAVTATDKVSGGGKAGIQIVSFVNIEGGKERTGETSSANRVRFNVPISYDVSR